MNAFDLYKLVPGLEGLDAEIAGIEESHRKAVEAAARRTAEHEAAVSEWRERRRELLRTGNVDDIEPEPSPPTGPTGELIVEISHERQRAHDARNRLLHANAENVIAAIRRREAEILAEVDRLMPRNEAARAAGLLGVLVDALSAVSSSLAWARRSGLDSAPQDTVRTISPTPTRVLEACVGGHPVL